MATSTASSTPLHPPAFQRSFTLPTRLNSASRSPITPKSPEADAVETLFVHEHGKIVSFSPLISSERSRSSSISSSSPQSDPVGTLPWRSQTERTLAAGLVRIYKVPGSVAFLNSGKIVQAILPKSQCWCVDGETIFVLRIGHNSYYRIELPNSSDDDKQIAEGLRSVLPRILQYETTACPFKRGFYVELPESPVTPKRPWKPKHSPTTASPAVSPLAKKEKDRSSSLDIPNRARALITNTTENSLITEPSAKADGSDKSLDQPLEADSPSKETRKRRVSQLVTSIEDKTQVSSTTPSSITTVCELETIQSALTIPVDIRAPVDLSTRDEIAESRTLSNNTYLDKLTTRDTINEKKLVATEPEGINSKDLGDEHACKHETYLAEGSVISTTSNSSTSPEIDGACGGEPKDGSNSERKLKDLPAPAVARPLTQSRSITAPPALDMKPTSPRSNARTQQKDLDTISLASSIESLESFHSFHSPTSPLAPSPSSSRNPSPQYYPSSLDVQRTRPLKRASSNLTTATSDDDSAVDMSTPPWPGNSPVTPVPQDFLPISEKRTPSPPSDQSASGSPLRSASTSSSIRRRLPRRRPYSPLLSPANIYVPRAQLSGGHLTSVILQKTCRLLLGPPVQLVALMLNIAAKFAAGSLTTTTFTYNERGQAIPCSWGEDEDDYEGEDAYGISLGGTPETPAALGDAATKDSNWDID